MKDGLKHIIGREIAAVVVAQSERDPRQQVFLIFSDGTRFEFWGASFNCCAGLDEAAGVVRYIEAGGGQIRRIYSGHSELQRNRSESTSGPWRTAPNEMPYNVSPDSLEEVLTRDLNAWLEAKAAIAKAKNG
jgi:hypothetical protein